VGGSGGQTPVSVADMAEDAIAFIEALGFAQVDLFGFSLGGFVAQAIAQTRPQLVRKIVLAGTGCPCSKICSAWEAGDRRWRVAILCQANRVSGAAAT
jgi:pimeloyl-ACP methyl ester carboxylesterase